MRHALPFAVQRAVFSAVLFLSLVACGGSPDAPLPEPTKDETPKAPAPREAGSAQVDGTVDGAPLKVVDAVVVPGPHGARVVLVDRADYCKTANVVHPNDATLTIDLGKQGASSIEPGDYEVPEAFADTSRALAARFDVVGPECATKAFMFRAGSAHVDDVAATHIAGTFSITIGNDKLRGSFVATPCDAPIDTAAALRCE